MRDVDLQFELTLQDLRHIVRTAFGIGPTLREVFLHLCLPMGVISTIWLTDLHRPFVIDGALVSCFFALAIPLPLELCTRGLWRTWVDKGVHRGRVRASELGGIEVTLGDEPALYPWGRIKSIRWTDQLVVLSIEGVAEIQLPRRVIPETEACFLRRNIRRNLDGEDPVLRRKHWLEQGTLLIAVLAVRLLPFDLLSSML